MSTAKNTVHRWLRSLFTIPLLALSSNANADEGIPAKVNVGFGLSEYQIVNAYNDKDTYIYGTELSIAGVVDQEVIERYKDKIPQKYRKAASKLGEVSVSHLFVPQTLYIHPSDGEKSAFGATWGIVPSISLGGKYISVGVHGGLIATYLYYNDEVLDDSIHFIRPGLRGGANMKLFLFKRYVGLEAGINKDLYISKQFFADENVSHLSGGYMMLHIRIPITIPAQN